MKKLCLMLMMMGVLLSGCGQKAEVNEQSEAIEMTSEASGATEENSNTLEFEANTIEGESLSSDIFSQSKLTMINIWGTYCNPCLSEMPDLGEIALEYDSAEFQIIGVICDVADNASEDVIANAKDLIQQTGANYQHILVNESLATNLLADVDAVPTTLFINQKGEVVGSVIGAQSKEAWIAVIEKYL